MNAARQVIRSIAFSALPIVAIAVLVALLSAIVSTAR
jgi:hypothetical protein